MTRLTSQTRIDLEFEHTLANAEWPEITPCVDTVNKPVRRGAIFINSNSIRNPAAESILKQLANMDITPKRSSISSYRTLLKKRAHSRRKDRVALVANKVMKDQSRDGLFSCTDLSSIENDTCDDS